MINESQWASNISTTDENLNVLNTLFQERSLPSLADSIFTSVELHGPTGAVFGVKSTPNGIGIVRNEVEVENYDYTKPTRVSVSRETLRDIKSQYIDDAYVFLSNYLKGVSNTDENAKLITFLNNNAILRDGVSIENITDPQEVWTKISYRVNSLVLEMNMTKMRSIKAFVVLPYAYASSIMAVFADLHNSELADKSTLFVGKSGLTEWYVNPNAEDNNIYVGLKDDAQGTVKKEDANYAYNGCAYISRYKRDITSSLDYESGDVAYFIWNRYALTMNPLHTSDNPMLVKFAVSSSD